MIENNKKHLLVISQYFYPEQFRINDLCSEWVNRGYKVTVITGIPNYPEGYFYKGYGFFSKRKEKYNGIDIIRIPIIPRAKNTIALILNYLSFVVSGYLWKCFSSIKADYVFIFEVSPMTQALPGIWYAKKTNIPCYLYVQDLWPENIEIVTGIKNKSIISSIGKMVDYIYTNCNKIFTTSHSFIKAIHDRGVELNKIEYWPQYAEDFYKPMAKQFVKEIQDDSSLNMIFTGNIGQAQGLEILPDTAQIILKKHPNLKVNFNIVGDGRYKESLIQSCSSKGVSHLFNFIPIQPATSIPTFLSACDVAFLPLSNNPVFEMTIPAKLQSYMACGMPIIASANGEVKHIIEDSGAGICCAAGNAVALADSIIILANKPAEYLIKLGTNSRDYYERNFNKESLLNKMDEYYAD